MRYKATQKLLDAIAKGQFETFGTKSTIHYVPVYECLIDINKDWTLTLIVDQDAIEKNSDYFEEII